MIFLVNWDKCTTFDEIALCVIHMNTSSYSLASSVHILGDTQCPNFPHFYRIFIIHSYLSLSIYFTLGSWADKVRYQFSISMKVWETKTSLNMTAHCHLTFVRFWKPALLHPSERVIDLSIRIWKVPTLLGLFVFSQCKEWEMHQSA